MGFHERAASEASALIDRLQAGCTERSVRQLQIFRTALDAAMQSVESAVAHAPAEQDDEVDALVERLAQAAAAHAQSLIDRATAETQATLEAAREELKDRTNQNEELAQALQAARAQLEVLRGEIELESDRAQAARTDRAQADEARAQVEAAWLETDATLQRETQARAAVEEQLKEAQSAVEAARLEAATSSKELEKEAVERAKLTAALTQVPPQPLDTLLATFQSLASATTINQVLVTLVDGLASDFSRVALFRVDGNRLEGVYQKGLNIDSDISKVVIPLTIDSLLTQAVASGCVEGFATDEVPEGRRMPFGGAPTFILTLPIIVRGRALAVIYADDSEQTEGEPSSPERSIKFAQALLWQAIPLLTRLSTDLVALTELRQYATMLVDEIGHIYNADAGAGKKADELHSRLRENLQCARQIYAQRVAPEGPFAATLLEEQLALQTQSGTPFGRDIALILDGSQPARALEAVS